MDFKLERDRSHHVYNRSPPRIGIPIYRVHQRLGDCLEQILRLLVKFSRGSLQSVVSWAVLLQALTRSGSHNPSATPNSLSLAVPATAKSLGSVKQPMRSVPAMNGLLVPLVSPAMIGSTKYGPNLNGGRYSETISSSEPAI